MDIDVRNKAKRLARRLHENREVREQQQAYAAAIRERNEQIATAPEVKFLGFICDEQRHFYRRFEPCDGTYEFEKYGYKAWRDDGDWPIAYYVARCKRGHRVVRYITDQWKDPYYRMSRRQAAMRAQYADDLLQPSDPRFREVYPAQWAALEEEREQREAIRQYEHDFLN